MKDVSEVKILTAGSLGADTEKVPSEFRRQFPQESETLGAFNTSRSLIGVTEGVNNESAKLVPGFVPTRYELCALAEHYLNKALDIEYGWELTSQVGSDQLRMESFAWRRLNTICELVGEDAVDHALSET